MITKTQYYIRKGTPFASTIPMSNLSKDDQKQAKIIAKMLIALGFVKVSASTYYRHKRANLVLPPDTIRKI